jgi:MFS family permease
MLPRRSCQQRAQRQSDSQLLTVLILAGIASGLMQAILFPAVPAIRREYHLSEETASWLVTAFLLTTAVCTPIFGRLGDIHGRRRMLLAALLALNVGIVLAAVTDSFPLLVLARMLQGVSAGVFPLSFGIVRDEMPPGRVAYGVGLVASMQGLGGAFGVALAGPIVTHLSYHWLFWVPLVLSAATTIAAFRVIPDRPGAGGGQVNWLSAALLSASLAILLLTITYAGQWGWTAGRTLTGFAVGLALGALWIANDARVRVPLVDMRTMRLRAVRIANVVSFLTGVALYSCFLLLPELAQEPRSTGYGLAQSATVGGLILLPWSLGMVAAGRFTGRINAALGPRVALASSCAAASVGAAAIVAWHGPLWLLLVGATAIGSAIGVIYGSLPNMIIEAVGPAETAVATGVNNVVRAIGGALGTQVAASLLAASVLPGGAPTYGAWTLAIGLTAAAFGLAAAAALERVPRAVVAPTQNADAEALQAEY